MALILHIDTAVEGSSVCVAEDGRLTAPVLTTSQKDQSGWLHTSISELMEASNLSLNQLDAVAVTIGPGSYTGLRVGLSAAKGLCFALQTPLIAINTLEVMASSHQPGDRNVLICPMIDARRMEVFTAVYDASLKVIMAPCAMILNGTNFDQLLSEHKMIFSGNGSPKWQKVLSNPNAEFSDAVMTAGDMVRLAAKYYADKRFADLAYTEPFYVKEFYSPAH
ncbi:tRNA (adenosine(37)-N6)-threonylcarbamoyltransferase complex dimerization subunit type 1 TsaB [Terrimonas sp. NA20]|uniref:tRNA (Adenosine(37)-N6)-threonylcarbamoyltransferase complex dimerization subunit type 1 TsaB n=1 Tax=Terrimonas ginsenosidimutans TaxID=2908004 RepID=A0ABS9KNM9_9BACT|nr:tRNA (adenosine(37)-N6)-threonylcarbamoyltransferase complex dimerization subunit type 1 TsaB [Terrimonas ginsenosidimutans]MCG2613924.1 tRNA (adenosine(37)-N6)-threonylcarbamoyltransferase complex dimerization subunit type 1 TsaB [Terrimonas ginsenosidimutans]